MNPAALLVVALVVIIVYYAYRSLNNAGYAAAIAWAIYPTEQILQQAFPIFQRIPSAINMALAAVLCATVARLVYRIGIRNLSCPLEVIAIYVLLLLCGVTYVWSIAPGETLRHMSKHLPYLVVFVMMTPLCFFDKQSMSAAVKATVCMGGIVSACLLVSDYGVRGVVLDQIAGTHVEGNPLAVASYASTVVMCSLFLLFATSPASWQRALLCGVILLACLVVVKSQSRGQIVALCAASLLWLPITRKSVIRRGSMSAVAVVAGLIFVAFIFIARSSYAHRWNTDFLQEAGNDRMAMVTRLLTAYSNADIAAWMTGLGSSSSFRIVGFYPHNVPVEILVEEGVVGFGLFIGAITLVFRRASQLLKRTDLVPNVRFHLGLLSALLTFHLSLSLKEGSLIGSSFLLSFLCCLAFCGDRYEKSERCRVAGRDRPSLPGQSRVLAPSMVSSDGCVVSLSEKAAVMG